MVTSYNAQEIVIVFDRYFSPSIKDNEHLLRGGFENRKYVISGGNQERPADFSRELRNKDSLQRWSN